MHSLLDVMKRMLELSTLPGCKSSVWKYLKCLLDLANNKRASFANTNLFCDHQTDCHYLHFVTSNIALFERWYVSGCVCT